MECRWIPWLGRQSIADGKVKGELDMPMLSEARQAEARRLVRDQGMLPSVAVWRVLRVAARQHASRPHVTGALNTNTRTNTEYPPLKGGQ